jgi:hypothetical protein
MNRRQLKVSIIEPDYPQNSATFTSRCGINGILRVAQETSVYYQGGIIILLSALSYGKSQEGNNKLLPENRLRKNLTLFLSQTTVEKVL